MHACDEKASHTFSRLTPGIVCYVHTHGDSHDLANPPRPMVKHQRYGSIGGSKLGSLSNLTGRQAAVPAEDAVVMPAVEEAAAPADNAVALPAVDEDGRAPKKLRTGDAGEGTVAQLLGQPALEELDLTGSELDADDCSTLATTLSASSCRLAVLNIDKAGIGAEGAHVLAAALEANATLTSISMQRNGLGRKGGRALGEALSNNSSVTHLDLSLNDIGPQGGLAFAEALRTPGGRLASLVMVRCGLGPDGGRALGAALEVNTSLTRLDVTQNDLGTSGGIAFGAALATNTTLSSLTFTFNRIGFGLERSVGALAQSLRSNSSLERLCLAQNELGALGGRILGDALEANRGLRHLSLARNELGDEGGAAVAKAIGSHPSLTSLSVSDNDLGAAGGAFSQAITTCASLTSLDCSKNKLGPDEGSSLGAALLGRPATSPPLSLNLSRNRVQHGAVSIAEALNACTALGELDLSENDLGADFGCALGSALRHNTSLRLLRLARNHLEDDAGLFEALADSKSLTEADLSSNAIANIPLACQLKLGRREGSNLRLDLSDNPLQSPPLGSRGSADELHAYLALLSSESTAVTRIRLMTLGFGGVGKTTFCAAATRDLSEMAHFQSSLTPLNEWDAPMVASWARCLGTEWSAAAARVLEAEGVRGDELSALVTTSAAHDPGPSKALERMAGRSMSAQQLKKLARAIRSLLFKGYFSTVGAVKVEGVVPLRSADGSTRQCSLVDFAGQMEFLVSHQLLLTTMHALCLVIKPAPSFASPEDPHGASRRHHDSWRYWLQYLCSLSKRPAGSLLLAVSQLDRVAGDAAARADEAADAEFAQLRRELGDELGDAPLRLDYSPGAAQHSMSAVRQRLSGALEAVARDWWVP